VSAKAPGDDEPLCVACGLCCTGAIFDAARLGQDEVALAEKLHLQVIQEDGGAAFALPCPQQHEGGACLAYHDERPRTCGAFVCATLAAVQAGEIGRAAALSRVEQMRSCVARVRARLPGASAAGSLWAAIARFSEEGERAPDPAAFRARHGEVLFDVLELHRLCETHFARAPGAGAPAHRGGERSR
jgi:hypothetical protein